MIDDTYVEWSGSVLKASKEVTIRLPEKVPA
jgi:hypothetical protein